MAPKKKTNTGNVLEYPLEDFIPFTSFYDKNTLLTKNQELIQIVKIPSYGDNLSDMDLFDLREVLRTYIFGNIKDDNISCWFYTVRKKADIRIDESGFSNDFCRNVGKMWNQQNKWSDQYVNEVYIAFVAAEEDGDAVKSAISIAKSMLKSTIKDGTIKKLGRLKIQLDSLVGKLMESLADYGIELLTMYKNESGVYQSQQLEFLSLLINGQKIDMEVRTNDISDDARKTKIAYGSNALEFDRNGEKKFASILTVKFYNEISATQLDKILQIPQEFVITQVNGFIDGKYPEAKYQDQRAMVNLSEDMDLGEISGLDVFVASNQKRPYDFAISQITITLFGKKIADLEANVSGFLKAANSVGLATAREDVFLPMVFWSQLPGNFSFVHRTHIIPGIHLGSFASLYNFPLGQIRDNHWGEPVAILPTALKTPYFFNLHGGESGCTAIIGPEETGKTTLTNFLVSQLTKQCNRFVYLDTKRSSEVFVNAIDGLYHKISLQNTSSSIKINPLALEKTPKNIKFLIEWMNTLIMFDDDGFIPLGDDQTDLEREKKYVEAILTQGFGKFDIKTLTDLRKLFNRDQTRSIYDKLGRWCKGGEYGHIFDNKTDEVFNHDTIGVALNSIRDTPMVMYPVCLYLLHRIMDLADETPMILVLDDAWDIFDNEIMSPKFERSIKTLAEKNVAVIVVSNAEGEVDSSHLLRPINHLFATEVFLANSKVSPYQKKIFNLGSEEIKMLGLMNIDERNMLVKSDGDTVIVSINLREFGDRLQVFSNTNVTINAMRKAMDLSPTNDSNSWLPALHQILMQYDRQMKLRKLREQEIQQLQWEEKNFSSVGKVNRQKAARKKV